MLFNATNSPELVGKTAYFSGCDEPAVFSNHFVRLRADPQHLDPQYLARWLHSEFERGFFRLKSKQWVNQASFDMDSLLRLSIRVPSLKDQRHVVELLARADALRAMRHEALDSIGSLPRALFGSMFVDTRASWEVASIASLATQRKDAIRTGPFGSQLLHGEFTDSGIAVLGIDNAVQNRFTWGKRRFISDEKYSQLRRYTVHPGDVLVTIMGTCGRVAVVPDDIPTAINTKHLCCISLDHDRCLPDFLWACLRFHPQVLRQLGVTQGAVMPGLNMRLIKHAEVPVPPIELQAEFVDRMASIRHQENLMNRSARELGDLFGAIQNRAFEAAA